VLGGADDGRVRIPSGRRRTGEPAASDADRDHATMILGAAYSEGRLSEDEYGDRLQGALSARTYAELDQLVTDLPAMQAAVVTPVPRTNGLAIASLSCGVAQLVVGPLGTIPAIAVVPRSRAI
jgi:Domain of unknown function (DUF1707)